MAKVRERPNPKVVARVQRLYKKDKAQLREIVESYYRVVDTRGTPKAVLVSMILDAEFGRNR